MPVLSIVILWGWPVFWLYWFISAIGAKKNISSGLHRFAGIRLMFFALAIVFVRFSSPNTNILGSRGLVGGGEAAQVIGFVLFLAGLALAIWARLHLGKNWGMPMTKKQNPELVVSGPYSFIRHPIYTGLLLAILGSALTVNAYLLVLLVLISAYFIYSATVEEKIMAAEFPKTYPDYKKKTKMLLPFVF